MATTPNPGSTLSYSLANTLYSNYYNLILSPVAYLEVALPIDYSILTINPIALRTYMAKVYVFTKPPLQRSDHCLLF